MKVTTLHRHCTVCRPGRLQYGALHIYAALSWVTSAGVDQATKEQQDWLSSAMQLFVDLKYWRRSHLQDSWFCNQENLWQPIFGSAAGMMMVGWRGVGCWAAGLLGRTIHLSVSIFLSEFLSQRPMIARFFCRAELVASSQSWIGILYLRLCRALTRPGAALLPRPLPRLRTRPVRRRVRGGAARCRICEYFYHTNTLHTLQIPTNQCHDLNWYLQSSKLSI